MAAYDYASGGFPTSPVTNDTLAINGTSYIYNGSAWEVVGGIGEGTDILSTGETGGTKYLREDGDGTSSWQAVAGGGGIGEFISTSIAISSDDTALANDNGIANIALGYQALTTNTTGYKNIGLGYQALKLNNGNRNVAIGDGASANTTTGSYNIGIGFYSLYGNNTTGSYNSGIGYQTGYNLTTGQYNVLNGYQAGLALTTGGSNIIMGREAGKFATTASRNVILGEYAGYGIGNLASDNIAIGAYSLASNYSGGSSAQGSNVAIGRSAGYKLGLGNAGGENNVLIGRNAGRSSVSGNACVYLGYNAGYSETASNKLHIANNSTESLIEGDFAAKTLNINGALTVNGAAVGGAMELISTTTVSSSVSSVEFTGLSGYTNYKVIIDTVGTDAVPYIRFSMDNTLITSASYSYRRFKDYTSFSTITGQSSPYIGWDTYGRIQGEILINTANRVIATSSLSTFLTTAIGTKNNVNGIVTFDEAYVEGAFTGISLLLSSGTFDSGKVSLYGIKS